jgi:hypothetical protein
MAIRKSPLVNFLTDHRHGRVERDPKLPKNGRNPARKQ